MGYAVRRGAPHVEAASPAKAEREIAALCDAVGIVNDGASLDAYVAGLDTVAKLRAVVKALFRALFDVRGTPPGV